MNISSAAGLVGFPGLGIYTASKHAVLGLTNLQPLRLLSQAFALTPSVLVRFKPR
ncbi:MAG: SDR family NAD(P)-dependent oxidoreductase [Heteroscytonema crispum UTEX LB 1556]